MPSPLVHPASCIQIRQHQHWAPWALSGRVPYNLENMLMLGRSVLHRTIPRIWNIVTAGLLEEHLYTVIAPHRHSCAIKTITSCAIRTWHV